MKIAYVVSLFPKISETFILREMEQLRARGAEIVVVSLKSHAEPLRHPGAEAFARSTIEAPSFLGAAWAFARRMAAQPAAASRLVARVVASHRLHPLMLIKGLVTLAAGAGVADRLRREKVDHVHAHWATYPAQVAWTIHALEGIPYSVTAHAHDIFLPNPLLAEKIRASAFTVTISGHNIELLRRLVGPETSGKIRLVRCGVPLEEFNVRRAGPADPGRLVSVGRLVDYKGFPTLVHAVSILRRKGRKVSCDIVGAGPMKGVLEGLIRRLDLEGSVRLRGAMTQPEVRETLEASGLCVLACEKGRDGQMDGIPVVLMEAMALGVPVVSTRISGIPELVEDGVTGLLAPPGDAAAVAGAIERLLEEPALAACLAAAARTRVEALHDASRNAGALLEMMIHRNGEGR